MAGCDSFNRTSMESKRVFVFISSTWYRLLIEPVWNRNLSTIHLQRMSIPFNRTSMESKHATETTCAETAPSFNRTSMESKHTYGIWNVSAAFLLIEPVWNRNEQERTPEQRKWDELLIEPVWNRNSKLTGTLKSLDLTFNRTSMESKHGCSRSISLGCSNF